MEGTAYQTLSVPVWAWQRDEMRAALRRRDVGTLFRLVQRYGGVSQSRLAAATGLLQGRISEIIKGTRMVTALTAYGGALHRGFRRFLGELQRTARRVM